MSDPGTEVQADKDYTKGESPKERAVTRVIRQLNALKWSDAEAESVSAIIRDLKALQEKLGG
jgi:hypothetical protein